MMATDVMACQRQQAQAHSEQLQQLQQLPTQSSSSSLVGYVFSKAAGRSSSSGSQACARQSSGKQQQQQIARPPQIRVEDSDMPWLGGCEPITWDCMRVALMGLDGAGKTSLLCAELAGPTGAAMAAPTLDTDAELVTVKRKSFFGHGPATKFAIIDFSGDKDHRSTWQTYSRCGTLVLYVVDSTKPERMAEAATHLRQVLLDRTSKDKANGRFLHFCILANKQDLPGALRPVEVANRLRVGELPCFEKVFGVSSTMKHPLRHVLRDLMAEKKLSAI